MSDARAFAERVAGLLGPETAADTLIALVDAIMPADDHPSASEAGGLEFLHRVLPGDRQEWGPRLRDVVTAVESTSRQAIGVPFATLTGPALPRERGDLSADGRNR